MPSLAVTKTYSNGAILSETDLDNVRDSLETFFNTTKIDGDNVQTGWITTAYLSATAGIVAGQLASNAVTTVKILDANVTTAKIADASVTAAKIATNTIFNGNCGTTGTFSVGASGPALSKVTDGLQSDGGNGGVFYPYGNARAGLIGVGTRTLGVKTAGGGNFPIVVSALPASHGLMIVRGYVTACATLTLGEGYTVANNSTGNCTITFTTAFAESPVFIATASTIGGGSGAYIATVKALSGSAATVELRTNGGTTTDVDFSFIAIAQRGA